MIKFGKWIAKHKVIIVIISMLLLIPSFLGMAATRVNYDILSYLPESLETVEGQDIMVDEFGMGAFSMVVVEDMELKDVAALKEKFQNVEHVKDVLWYDSVADLSIPVSMIPEKFKDGFFNGDATMMIALFDNTTSSDAAMEAVSDMRKIANEQCFISGMSGVVTDIKNLALEEMPIYVVIAACLSLLVLLLAMDSLVIPVLFLLSVGLAVVYNLGTNIFFGEVCYITKSLTAVLQLGVTMDYSIFLLNSFEAYKKKYDEKERAMAHAIGDTFKSVAGSSVTTIAGFLALCVMTFALGRDMGIVMAKGVVIGVICCITTLPAMILVFDGVIEKTKHKPLVKSLDKASGFITKHYKVWLLVFLVMLYPAVYGNNHTQIYYNIDALHAAISNDVQITFRYFNWVLNFSASPRIQKQYRRDGARYRVSPWALTWDNENYYLIAFDHDADEIRHYRVDKMDSLVQTDLPREGKQLFDDRFDAAAYSRKVFGMFSGEEKTVKLKCLNRFIGVMLDRFGSSLRLFPADNEHFYLDVDVVVSPQFFSWVFSLEGDVRIVNPPEVCEAFEKQIHKFID